jgi:hypothetical protein
MTPRPQFGKEALVKVYGLADRIARYLLQHDL